MGLWAEQGAEIHLICATRGEAGQGVGLGEIRSKELAATTTQAFRKTKTTKKLYYFCTPKAVSDMVKDYFIYFPEGKRPDEVDKKLMCPRCGEKEFWRWISTKAKGKISTISKKNWSWEIRRNGLR